MVFGLFSGALAVSFRERNYLLLWTGAELNGPWVSKIPAEHGAIWSYRLVSRHILGNINPNHAVACFSYLQPLIYIYIYICISSRHWPNHNRQKMLQNTFSKDSEDERLMKWCHNFSCLMRPQTLSKIGPFGVGSKGSANNFVFFSNRKQTWMLNSNKFSDTHGRLDSSLTLCCTKKSFPWISSFSKKDTSVMMELGEMMLVTN